nr:PREDICTED: spermatid perinuclear RNA-binding protein-like [Paralichthys olivaceus]
MRSFRSFANDDRHVMAKHASIYPAPEELEAVQTLVSTVEGALKKVSDWMDGLNKSSGKTSTENKAGDDAVEDDAAETKPEATSVLCGVTRVGLVAKGLLIKGDMDLELVLMCREKPTKLLLYTVSANLPLQIQTMTEDKYEVRSCVPEAAIRVCSAKNPQLMLKITLSSLTMRGERHSGTDEAPQVRLTVDPRLSATPLLTRRPPSPPSSRKPWVQGASPTSKSNQPTHSLPQTCSLPPPPHPLTPPSADWTSLWVAMKLWSMSINEHTD